MIKQGRGIEREMHFSVRWTLSGMFLFLCLSKFCCTMCFRFEILVRKPKKMFALDTRLGKSVDRKCVIYISYFLMMMKHTLVKFWQIDMDFFFLSCLYELMWTDWLYMGREVTTYITARLAGPFVHVSMSQSNLYVNFRYLNHIINAARTPRLLTVLCSPWLHLQIKGDCLGHSPKLSPHLISFSY